MEAAYERTSLDDIQLPKPRGDQEPLLVPGETCWRIARADRFAALIDAADYFAALRKAILAAEHSVVLIGWDIDSRTQLVPEKRPKDGYPATLLPFLNAVLAEKPELHVVLLAWDFSVIYAFEREFLPSYVFRSEAHPRLHFVLDNAHALGASHHQKLAVIDGCVAFAGGMDLTIRRWDRAAHAAREPARVDPAGEPYAPMHDVQLAVDGDAARALFELAKLRLEHALKYAPQWPEHGPPPALPDAELGRSERVWPADLEPDVRDVDVGIARTHASTSGDEEDVREVEKLTTTALLSAKRYIFIENQYLTAAAAGAALAESLSQPEGPEVLAILPKAECGWLEQSSMGKLRAKLLAHLRHADRYGRLHIYYPEVPGLGDQTVNVHSKVIITDGTFLKIGSANLSNRSLGLDTECDLVLESRSDGDEAAQGILRVLSRLLGEHLDLPAEECAAAIQEQGGLVSLIEGRRGHPRSLQPLPEIAEAAPLNLEALGDLVVDPERPMGADVFLKSLLPLRVRRPTVRSLISTLGMLIPVLLVLWLWHSLPDDLSPERIGQFLHALRDQHLGFVTVCGAYALLGLAFVPITALIAATALVFEPLQALSYALCGSLLSAALAYGVGRVAGNRVLRFLDGPRLRTLRERLHTQAFRATVVARLLPVGNFTVINLFAGALKIPFLPFLVGNLVGMSFGIAGLTLLAEQLAAAWQRPSAANVGLLVAYVLALFGVSLGLSKLFERRLATKQS
ncbi:MAG TPA: VTT domain-containing protein [Polyangiales bacterium]|nr:VTT domain-containing protein [Polyangiales bacterium]